MSFSNGTTIAELTANQVNNENLTPSEALRVERKPALERLQKRNSEQENEENAHKRKKANPETLADRMKLFLSRAKGADAHFLVGKCDKKEIVHAHQGILMISSSVFEEMFQNEAENSNSSTTEGKVEKDGPLLIPDVDVEAFKLMLRFIYSDDLSEFNGKNVVEVLYAARKFNVIRLIKVCVDFPISQLSNVFVSLSIARFNDLLNDFAQRCLDYIDKNADDLLKSDEFLQIGQNLLCEIFERDQLQISGEISIWKAALRWADKKCGENAIDCSAENRRAMLGPALLKIRFPLFSEEEFSDKIIPSDVLSKDELLAVYQFKSLPNRRRISNGFFPMQFPTNGRISDRKEGTLLLDIENVSEFAREAVGNSRHSEKVYINGFLWKILAQIKTKNGSTDNEKWLGFFFRFDTTKKDSHWRCCVRSATFRIISHRKEAENSNGTFCDCVFDNKSTGWGFENFLSFAELLDPRNGFYSREDYKVTLAIDVILQDEKIEKFISNQIESKGTLFMDIEKVSEFAREIKGSERKSKIVHIKGFPWKLWTKIEKKNESADNEKWLGIYLLYDGPNEDQNWSCKCSTTFRIVSQKSDVPDFRRELSEERTYNSKSNNWGFPNFISFTELMDPQKGFYDKSEDKVTLAIDVTVKEAKTAEKS
ncbi:hypothetical protein niasHS_016382 [Heterodera schachtii]|uniref:BTB domain-containing protein n=1 Tax=Heterodera schachtii TaxID=97005 RepID=A0ABD2HV19_HETSC